MDLIEAPNRRPSLATFRRRRYRRVMKRLAFLVAFLAAIPAATRTGAPDTLVLLVRHAEKVGPTGDVSLSPAGEERAHALVQIAKEAGVAAVITTQFQRTRQTGAPAAAALGLTPVVVAATADAKEHARQIAILIREHHRGQAVLVVGHSNTVPAIVAALGGPQLPDLCDSEYDRLFIVAIGEAGGVRVVQSRYGSPSPTDASCAAMR